MISIIRIATALILYKGEATQDGISKREGGADEMMYLQAA
jgi:hypothetical protein